MTDETQTPETEETAAPVEQVEMDATSTAVDEGGEPTEQTAPEPQEDDDEPAWFKKRFDKLTAQRYQAQAEAEAARREAEQLREKLQALETPKAEPLTPPDINQFDDLNAYNAAMAEYTDKLVQERVKQTASEYMQRQAESQETAAQEREKAARLESFEAQKAAARKSLANFDQVALNPELPVSQAMADIITESDKGAQVLYHLGQNPQLAANIATMTPTAAARAIGQIEATLPVNKPKSTSAPPPPKPSTGGNETVAKDPSKLSMEEWARERRAGRIK